MSIQAELVELFDALAELATSLQRKLSWFLGVGLLASTYLAWAAFSQHSYLWWNIAKCMTLLLPVLIWLIVWAVLGQLREAPELAASLASEDDGVLAKLQSVSLSDKRGLRGLFGTLRAFRQQEGLSVVLDTVGSVGMLANPLFAILAFIMLVILFIFILIAPILLLF
jgi:hypothetical protein